MPGILQSSGSVVGVEVLGAGGDEFHGYLGFRGGRIDGLDGRVGKI